MQQPADSVPRLGRGLCRRPPPHRWRRQRQVRRGQWWWAAKGVGVVGGCCVGGQGRAHSARTGGRPGMDAGAGCEGAPCRDDDGLPGEVHSLSFRCLEPTSLGVTFLTALSAVVHLLSMYQHDVVVAARAVCAAWVVTNRGPVCALYTRRSRRSGWPSSARTRQRPRRIDLSVWFAWPLSTRLLWLCSRRCTLDLGTRLVILATEGHAQQRTTRGQSI